MTTPIDDVLEDLVAEYDRLESILASLSDAQWRSESAAPGWTVTDVMIHLAQTEEGVSDSAKRAWMQGAEKGPSLGAEKGPSLKSGARPVRMTPAMPGDSKLSEAASSCLRPRPFHR